ncbi:putative MFS family arabinose efflux permease [Actinorugispora endophytica]|uniref:Putative MFS family arabinose efflux permease n=2 Tax=Actinorugispora endophytica TaxID=1605990 RepID=A0A4R6URU6_9ACTN|nr:putative MFS family arabinose efflux permease [Actinorugispora endophytica]
MGERVGGGAVTPQAAERIQRRTVLVLMAVQAIGGIGIGTAFSVGGLVAQDLTGSQAWSGMATTMSTVGAAVFALPLAAAAGRRGRRPTLSLGWFAAAAGGLVAITGAQAGLFPLYLSGMALFGAATATNLQSRYAAADLATDRTRGRDLSVVLWATTVGSVAGPNLTGPGALVAGPLGLQPLLGPFVFSTVSFVLAGLLTAVLLRPDPLLTARGLADGGDPGAPGDTEPRRTGLAASFAVVAASPRALLALAAIVASHAVMVMVMTMTPVHMEHGGSALTVIGLTISLHIAGMYAFSPLVGWLADRFGRVPVLLAGQLILVVSAAVSALSGHDPAAITAGLVLLGLGWSFGLVSASTLLAEALRPDERPAAQGLSDLLMNAGGAACGALSGVLLAVFGFGGLNTIAAALTVPVIAFALFVLLTRRS